MKKTEVWTRGYFYIHRGMCGVGYYGYTFKILPSVEIRHSVGCRDGKSTQTIIEFDWLLFGWQICFNVPTHKRRKVK